jgi:acyl-CoA thioester hydrolase
MALPNPESPFPNPAFAWPVRVYWEDTDAGGVVYHAAYLRFLERARTEWLRANGIGQAQLRTSHGIVFVVTNVQVDFLLPARLDDELHACIGAFTRRSASLRFTQCILRPADGAVLVQAQVRAACVEATNWRPRRIPDHLFTEHAHE